MSTAMTVIITPKDGKEMTKQDERRLMHKLQAGVNEQFEEEYNFDWTFEPVEVAGPFDGPVISP